MSIGFIYSKDVLIKAKKADGTYYPLFAWKTHHQHTEGISGDGGHGRRRLG